MAVIAVAGGTGNVGRTIVEALVAAGKHDIRILARKANPELEAKLGAAIIPVDYNDVAATTRALEGNNVHTVISAISMMILDGTNPEISLIAAADASKATRRIISSGWGIPHTTAQIAQLPSVKLKLDAEAALAATKDLEHTVVQCGFFLDYWTAKPSYMAPQTLVIDVPNRAAAIPGTGDVPVAFTHTTDVARFVSTLLDAEKWEAESIVVGDKVTWNQFLALAEGVTGAKFKVGHDDVETLKSGKVTELPGHVPAYAFFPKEMLQSFHATFGLWFQDGLFDLTASSAATGFRALSVKEALEWK
jgi:nucleoside-diphosphate-sugar epimerase